MIELINKLKNRIFMLVAEGIMQSVTSTQGQHLKAKLSLLADEIKEDYDIIQDYGFTSIIPKNSSVVALCIGGSRDNGIVIASDSKQYKPSLADGEVAIYTKFGQKIHLDSNGDVNIFCDDTINITAATANFSGDINVTGSISADGDIKDNAQTNTNTIAAMRTIYNAHTHTETGTTTNAPNSTM